MLVDGVRAVAVGAETVERGNPERRGERRLRRAAGRDLLERGQAELGGSGAGGLVDGHDVRPALERRVEGRRLDLENDPGVRGPQGLERGARGFAVGERAEADVELGFGEVGHDVGARAAADRPDVDSDAARQVRQRGGVEQAPRELDDGVGAPARSPRRRGPLRRAPGA